MKEMNMSDYGLTYQKTWKQWIFDVILVLLAILAFYIFVLKIPSDYETQSNLSAKLTFVYEVKDGPLLGKWMWVVEDQKGNFVRMSEKKPTDVTIIDPGFEPFYVKVTRGKDPVLPDKLPSKQKD